MNCPDAIHDQLSRLSGEMDHSVRFTLTERRDLRTDANEGYRRAVAGTDYH